MAKTRSSKSVLSTQPNGHLAHWYAPRWRSPRLEPGLADPAREQPARSASMDPFHATTSRIHYDLSAVGVVQSRAGVMAQGRGGLLVAGASHGRGSTAAVQRAEAEEVKTDAKARPATVTPSDKDDIFYTRDGHYLGFLPGKEGRAYVLDLPYAPEILWGSEKTGFDASTLGSIKESAETESHAGSTDPPEHVLAMSHRNLRVLAGVAIGEENGSMEGTYAIASAIANYVEFKNKNKRSATQADMTVLDAVSSPSYSFASKSPVSIHSNAVQDVQARGAAINALLGGHDYSVGATHWDGFDYAARGDKHPKSREQGTAVAPELEEKLKSHWTDKKIKAFSGGAYNKFADDISESHPAEKGINKGRILYKATVVLGGTIFWAPNTGAKENDGYLWRYF